jgi:uncharacterized protein
MEAIIKKTEDFVREYMSDERFDSSHDYAHVERVSKMAMYLARQAEAELPKESQALQADVIRLGALLHDVWDRKYEKDPKETRYPDPKTVKASSSTVSESKADEITTASEPSSVKEKNAMLEILETKLGMPHDLALKIKLLISHVSWTTEMKDPQVVKEVIKQIPELAYVQDADRIDAIGAIGVGRAFTYNACAYERAKQKGERLNWASGNSMNDAMRHYDQKLLHIVDWMKTPEGKKVALERTQRLKMMQQWWKEEMELEMTN